MWVGGREDEGGSVCQNEEVRGQPIWEGLVARDK